jgi:hypothetical protein
MRAFLDMNPPGSLRSGGSIAPGQVQKTAHHTIPASHAPQIHRDPRFFQMVNDPRFYDDPGGFLRRAYPTQAEVAGAPAGAFPAGIPTYERLPAPRTVQVPSGARPTARRPTPTRQARNLRETLEGMSDRGDITVPNRGYFDAGDNSPFVRELQEQGGTGAWTNPRDPNQRYLLNAHQLIGHNYAWESEMQREIFDLYARLGIRGEPGRRVGAQGLMVGARSPRWMTDGGGGEGEGGGGASASFHASLEARIARPLTLAAPVAAPSPAGASPAAGAAPAAAPAAGLPAADGAARAPAPEPPPVPVPYSPMLLMDVREQRISIAAAIEAVQGYAASARESEATNRAAGATARELGEQAAGQGERAAGEQADVQRQQGQLEQASGAQTEMSASAQRAGSETDRGREQGESTQGEGGGVTVEAKPEEPKKKSWLARAWDATAGWAWRRLVAPVIAAARRKVATVMQKVGEFINNMISQALGLDEIEAELNAGGEDIGQRQGSLTETQAGLTETGAQADLARDAAAEHAGTADANAEQAAAVALDADRVLEALRAQEEALRAQEEAGRGYVAAFAAEHAEWFAAEARDGSGGAAPAEPAASAPVAEASVDAEPAPPTEEERVTRAHVTPVVAYLESVRRGDLTAYAELTTVATQSGAAADPARREDERDATAAALSGFRQGRGDRDAALGRLLERARGAEGLVLAQGEAELAAVADEGARLAGELEADRVAALRGIQQGHTAPAAAPAAAAP